MMELRWDNAYKDFTKFLEHNRCSTDNPASSNPLSLFLSPPSPFHYSYFLPFSSTEFLEKEKTRGATSGKTSLFLVGLWLLWFCDMDCSHRCWPCLLTNTDFFFSCCFSQEGSKCSLSSQLLESPLKPGEAGEQGPHHPEWHLPE